MTHVFVFLEILFGSSCLWQLPGGFYFVSVFVFGAALYEVVDLFFFLKLHIRLRPSLFFFFLRPGSFGSSAIKLGVVPFLSGATIFFGGLFLLIWKSGAFFEIASPTLLFVLTALSGALSLLHKEKVFFDPIFLAQRDLVYWYLDRKKTSIRVPDFPQEKALFLSKQYPLLRSTERFKGAKVFDLTIGKEERPHLIFIVLESFRAKNVGCLGGDIPLSPHFDALAKKGVLFSNFHSTGTLTSRCAMASLFGMPPAHIWWRMNRYCEVPLHGLPQILSGHGYHNALIQGGSVAFDYGIEFFREQGYQTILGNGNIAQGSRIGSSWGVYDEHLMPFAASWLAEQSEPTFLNLYTITNHHPWISPSSWVAPKETQGHPYLSTFAYTDHCLGLFVEQLREKGLLEKSILFIFGDHGQILDWENPYSALNSQLHQENVHVPLLIYAEGRIKEAKQVDTISSHVDLLPTILDLLQLKDPHHSLGKSLMRGSSDPIFFSHPYDSGIQGCRKGAWKFLMDETGSTLYDLSKGEQKTENPLVESELKKATIDYISTLNHLYKTKALAPKDCQPPLASTGAHVLHLDFSGSLRLTDTILEASLRACPNLVKLNLAGCRLITDRGVAAVFKFCPGLEELNIDELDDVTGEGWQPAVHLSEFRAVNCLQFKGWQWLKSLISLRGLYLESEFIVDAHLIAMAESVHSLHTLDFKGMEKITDLGLGPLFTANPFLKMVSIKDCPKITDASISQLNRSMIRLLQIESHSIYTERN